MDVEPKHEIFGREVEFERVTPITRVYQPGILDPSSFFNPNALRGALTELCILDGREILVYFRNIAGRISACNEEDRNRKWWETFQRFRSLLGASPAGCEVEYFYGPEGGEYSSPEFVESKDPYQAFVKLFGNAVQGFSCFVNGGRAGISFSSNRTNYNTIRPGEEFIHDQITSWTGDWNTFFYSARNLSNSFNTMMIDGHSGNVSGYNGRRCEIRIIQPEMGAALVGSLVGDSSVTLFIDSSSLDGVVENYKCRTARRKHFESIAMVI
ncbi:hypothetical protein HY500_04180 [Candidatus Woesearchaeota archaeon]|nr:hypothetical protein [Candidatus Woesearchaeota archaeon]